MTIQSDFCLSLFQVGNLRSSVPPEHVRKALRLTVGARNERRAVERKIPLLTQRGAKPDQKRNEINGRGPPPAGRMPLPVERPGFLQGRPHRSGRARFGHPVPRVYGFATRYLSATVALTRLLMTLSSSRVSQRQFRRPTPPFATHRLPRVGFPAFQRYYEGANEFLCPFQRPHCVRPSIPLGA